MWIEKFGSLPELVHLTGNNKNIEEHFSTYLEGD